MERWICWSSRASPREVDPLRVEGLVDAREGDGEVDRPVWVSHIASVENGTIRVQGDNA